jgi:hypothetical protein
MADRRLYLFAAPRLKVRAASANGAKSRSVAVFGMSEGEIDAGFAMATR